MAQATQQIDHVFDHGTSKEVQFTFVDDFGNARVGIIILATANGSDVTSNVNDGLVGGILGIAPGIFRRGELINRLAQADKQ